MITLLQLNFFIMNKQFQFNKQLYPEVEFMNGPYLRKDGRLMLTYKTFENKKGSISYPKYLKEKEINRRLSENETIDHINGDPLDNNLSNLRIIERNKHITNDVRRICKSATKIYCQYCGKEINIENRKISQMNRRNTGYFCSRSCSGKYGKEIQLKQRNKEFVEKEKVYYCNNHSQYENYYWDDSEEFSILNIINDILFTMFK